jgi:MFS transporter, DHA2 family, multidrug resistance protein
MLPEFLRNVASQTLSATQTGRVMAVYALTAAAVRPLVVGVVARFGQRKTICGAMVCLITSMLLINRFMTTDTPAAYFYLPLILYALCLSALLPAVGSGTVARIEQPKLLDGVSLYMTFRQFGAALGVALLTILVERRETLHSARLFDHLRTSSQLMQDWMTTASHIIVARGGYSAVDSHEIATKLLAETGGSQAATLAYADAFLFMAVIGIITLCLVPIIPPTPVAPKTPPK